MNTAKPMAICTVLCSILATPPAVPALALPDSLHVQLWAGAQVSDQKPAGLKANESGILDAWMTHAFTDAIFCRVFIKGTASFSTPFIEEGSVGYRKNGFAAKGGMLSTHIGRTSLYKPFSVFNRFTRTSVIWDSYGFGLAVDSRPGSMGLGGAATINSRENGAVHVLWTALDNSAVTERVLAGVQTGELETQDNIFTAGNDLALRLNKLKVHIAAKYSAYQGYGNPTMKPGHLVELLGEARVDPVSSLTLSALFYYKDFKKSYAFHSLLGGLDGQYMPLHWLGMYAGYEYLRQSNDIGSHVPQIGMALAPVSDNTLCRIGIESTITGQAYLNRITALLWFAF